MFRRSETQHQEMDEGMLSRVYRQGFNACLDGLPRTPPAGYDGLVGLDLIGTWSAGWDGACRELGAPSSSRSAASHSTHRGLPPSCAPAAFLQSMTICDPCHTDRLYRRS